MYIYFTGKPASSGMSERKPELRELALALRDLTWADVIAMAVQLDIEFSILKEIQQQNDDSSVHLLSAMDTCLKTDENASWADILRP